MSKPKPGLGKVVVRNFANVVHHPPSTSGYGTSSLANSSHAISTAPVYAGSRREFATLGLPSSAGRDRWAGTSEAEREIVLPFRPARLKPSPTPTSRSPSSAKGKRPLSTLSPSPLSGDIPLLTTSTTTVPVASQVPLWSALLEKAPQWTFSHFNFSNPSAFIPSLDIIVPPSPPPTIRPTRLTETHPALSPSATSATSHTDSSTGIPTFVTLGLPAQHPLTHLTPPPDAAPSLVLSTSQLIFHLGASGLAKERPLFTPPSRPRSPAPPPRPRSFPLPDVVSPGPGEMRSVSVGEDAYFARMDGMCIADGVGGWARSGRGGADAGRWSRLLTHFCEVEMGAWAAGRGVYALDGVGDVNGADWGKAAWQAVNAPDGNGAKGGMGKRKKRALDPVEIMQRGYEKCLSCFTKEGIHGSSTCLLALLHDSTLSIANLGDCCLLIVRGGEIIFRTDEMQHAFNFPLQLGTHSRDEPMKDAQRYDVSVSKGDIVVLGSDGLMDNLFDEDIVETLAQFSPPSGNLEHDAEGHSMDDREKFSPQSVSEALCQRARAVSEQTSATTPFMVRAIEEGIDFVGGKKDDISVVVGVVGDREAGDEDGLALHTH